MTPIPYIRGVLDGDGCVNWSPKYPRKNPKLELKVVNKAFALEFFRALKNLGLTPRFYERDVLLKGSSSNLPRFKRYGDRMIHLFRVRAVCKPNMVEKIKETNLSTEQDKIAYLRGLYQSEGHYQEKPNRYLSISNKNIGFLKKVKQIIESLGIYVTNIYTHSTCSNLVIYRKEEIKKFLSLIGGYE